MIGEASRQPFLKMCGAMDGGAQAHMDVLEAFFKKGCLLADLLGTRQEEEITNETLSESRSRRPSRLR
ncbi:hypothetical protein MDG893_03080 [Marinobacter algicola DG893]|uniref:Uncharacterized protein n=1 Tax=Marinobacter algicola DG893 TaxID=443152 RepID=A6EXM1_9GAMM|nr:hypothetical protein MDG893_03080 [Marinobacter algicola DG893]